VKSKALPGQGQVGQDKAERDKMSSRRWHTQLAVKAAAQITSDSPLYTEQVFMATHSICSSPAFQASQATGHPVCQLVGAIILVCRFRVNMGNIHHEQGKFPAAIKMYRMALDALPAAAAGPRSRLMTNIGLAFVQLGQYADAAATFETAMEATADHQARPRNFGLRK